MQARGFRNQTTLSDGVYAIGRVDHEEEEMAMTHVPIHNIEIG